MWDASRLKLVLKANVLGLNANKYLHPFSIMGVTSLSGRAIEEAVNRTSGRENQTCNGLNHEDSMNFAAIFDNTVRFQLFSYKIDTSFIQTIINYKCQSKMFSGVGAHSGDKRSINPIGID